jgi:hypothetical protein
MGYVSTLMRVQSAFERAESASSIAISGGGIRVRLSEQQKDEILIATINCGTYWA